VVDKTNHADDDVVAEKIAGDKILPGGVDNTAADNRDAAAAAAADNDVAYADVPPDGKRNYRDGDLSSLAFAGYERDDTRSQDIVGDDCAYRNKRDAHVDAAVAALDEDSNDEESLYNRTTGRVVTQDDIVCSGSKVISVVFYF
jgi:hypothetical protein